MKFVVLPVKKPLAAVSKIIIAGHRVVLDVNPRIELKSGGYIPREAKNGVFIPGMWFPVMGVDEDDPDRGQLAPIEVDLLDEPGGDERGSAAWPHAYGGGGG